MMNSVVKELIVLQVIYSLILPRVEEVESKERNKSVPNSGNNNNNNSNTNNNDSNQNHSQHSYMNNNSNYNNIDNKVISSHIKLSLVKITNEIQNSILVNEITNINNEAKLTIQDILNVIKDLFPLQRTILIDGQLSFHNLKIKDLKNLIVLKYDEFREDQINSITDLENQILKMSPLDDKTDKINVAMSEKRIASTPSSASPTTSTTPLANEANVSQGQRPPQRGTTTPAATSNSMTAPTTNINTINKDPKREKLLQLYRDTVLNKLQSKTKILDKLYSNIEANEEYFSKIVVNLLELEKIKLTTPASVHNLQLILQKSVSDGIMGSYTGSPTWRTARQVQIELDDTVQFMRRALE